MRIDQIYDFTGPVTDWWEVAVEQATADYCRVYELPKKRSVHEPQDATPEGYIIRHGEQFLAIRMTVYEVGEGDELQDTLVEHFGDAVAFVVNRGVRVRGSTVDKVFKDNMGVTLKVGDRVRLMWNGFDGVAGWMHLSMATVVRFKRTRVEVQIDNQPRTDVVRCDQVRVKP